jgi:circadian clock protein KaiA
MAAVSTALQGNRHTVITPRSRAEFFDQIEQEKQHLDCLILEADEDLSQLANWLHVHATVLPLVIVSPVSPPVFPRFEDDPLRAVPPSFFYHNAEVQTDSDQLGQLDAAIDRAIAQFLKLSPSCRLGPVETAPDTPHELSTQNFLMLQQRRLTDKLKERLGYLGVYYKRSPRNFLRNLPPEERQELLSSLKVDYREIILRYFANTDGTLNQRIDDYVNTLFFADITVSQLVETHMELMDEFAKQLQLEGRSEEILLDYRLTLIDAIAHLCEMYRRSIPRDA